VGLTKESSVIRRALRSLPLLALTCATFVAGGCGSIPVHRGSAVETSSAARLEAANPVDVVVAPIENASASKRVPMAQLRDAFEAALVQRRYTPLATEYVDTQVADATYRPGALREDAVLQVAVEAWDESLWGTHGAITATLRATLVDARGGGTQALWHGKVEQRFELGKDRESFASEEPRRRLISKVIADELLAALPARQPKPGRTTGN
jgi:hypothetical protein